VSTQHVFVDETKARGYRLVAGVLVPADLDPLRKTLRRLILPRQHRLHMAKESDPRRKLIAAAILDSGVQGTVYDAGQRHANELRARAACLGGLVADLDPQRASLIVLEQDDSMVAWDLRQLYALARGHGNASLRYEHRRAGAEQLLAIPDAIAWCWARGGHWRRLIEPAVKEVRDV
jgi:hypothetical protein